MNLFKRKIDIKSYQIKNAGHANDMMLDLKKRKRDRKLQMVAGEIVANIIEAKETAEVIVNGSMLQAIIDKTTGTTQGFENLKTAIARAKTENNYEPITFSNKTGGFGTKMILNSGYNIEYRELQDCFFLVVYKEI